MWDDIRCGITRLYEQADEVGSVFVFVDTVVAVAIREGGNKRQDTCTKHRLEIREECARVRCV
jgi:hypothetical protein